MGDYIDFLSFSERQNLAAAMLHDSSGQTIDNLMLEQTTKLAKEMEFMRGKLLGCLEGNHWGEFQNRTSTTQKMCELLGCQFLGYSAFIRLSFVNCSRHATFDIWAHHGTAASRTLGSSILSVEKMEQTAEADAYLSGHDHRKYAALKARLRLGEGGGGVKLSQRQILLGRTGSFLKGYVEGEPSYIARRGLPPTDLGTIEIELVPRRTDNGNMFHIDIHCRT